MSRINDILKEVINEHKLDINNNHFNSNILLVDSLNQFIRSFSVCPVTNDDGQHIGAITGWLMTVGSAIKLLKPTRVIAIWDGAGGSAKRRGLFTEYKANRKPHSTPIRNPSMQFDEDPKVSMFRQSKRLIEYLDILPITTIIVDRIEADDVIAYLAKYSEANGNNCTIMSTDRDFLQLASDKIKIWSPTKKKLYFKQDIMDEYGVSAINFLTVKCMCGDSGDNIPGVPRMGIKTLIKLFPQLKEDRLIGIDELLALASTAESSAAIHNILEHSDRIQLNYKLMQLHDVDISGSNKVNILEMFEKRIPEYDKVKFYNMLNTDKCMNAIKNLDKWGNEVFGYISYKAREHFK